ncbi:MAG: MarR family transcriptional regulator [Chloroflexota bacterium]
MAEWSFLTNYGLVLTYIGHHPDSTGREIAEAVGITERAVRTIVNDLRTAGYLEPEKVGRRNRYRVNATQLLRYLGNRAVTVGDLIELLWRDRDRAGLTTGSSPSPLGGRPAADVVNPQRLL